MTQDAEIDVSILVVSYNTREMTDAALRSVRSATANLRYEIIVVDNASTDGSAQLLQGHGDVSRLIALDENIGFARATNLASEYTKGRYVLLLNPDTVVLEGAIDKLVAFADDNKQALIWGGRTVFGDHSLNPASCWRKMGLWNQLCRVVGLTGLYPNSEWFNSEAFGGWQRDTVRQVDIVSGCFFLMPTTVWTALGGFDPVFFMYGEDADLCLRAARIGAKPMITPDAEIVHYGGASEATRAAKMVKLLAAKVTLIDRHWPEPFNDVGRALLMGWPLSRWLALAIAGRAAGREDLNARAAVWKDIWDQRIDWQYGYAKQSLTDTEREAQTPLVAKTNSPHHA